MSSFICKPSKYSLLRRANLHGFAALPDELFLEVLSHFPPNPVTISAPSESEVIRRETLRSLSEVCQNLRRVFRPHLWQRVEVYAGLRVGEKKLYHVGDRPLVMGEPLAKTCVMKHTVPKKHFAKELLKQLNIVTVQDPVLAQCVRIVNIEVNAATFRPIFNELGRCFSLFPNLHTVKIITTFSYINEGAIAAVKRGFKKKILFPQIRSAILTPSVYPLLAVCPNLESFATFKDSPLLLSLMPGLPALQILSCPLSITSAAKIAEDQSSLQQIMISIEESLPNNEDENYETSDLIKTIQLFRNLRTLIFYREAYNCWAETTKGSVESAFRNLPPADRKNLKEVIFMECYDQQEEILVLS